MKKSNRFIVLLSGLLITSCANLTPEQTKALTNALANSSVKPSPSTSPSSSSSQTATSSATVDSEFSGIVKDSKGNTPIAKVKVTINDQSTETDESGKFSFKNLTPGVSKVYFFKEGEYDVNQGIVIEKQNKTFDYLIINNGGISADTQPSTPPNPLALANVPLPDDLPESSFKTQTALTGIWEFTFYSKASLSSNKSVIAIKPSESNSNVSFAAEIAKEDQNNALNGKVSNKYLDESDFTSLDYGIAWNSKYFTLTYFNYLLRRPTTNQSYIATINPLIAIDKNLLKGKATKITILATSRSSEEFIVTAKRVKDSYTLSDKSGKTKTVTAIIN